jgi:hypothetical protein
MRISDAIEELTKLRAYYPVNKIGDETLALYAAELGDYSQQEVARACRALVRTSKWFPSIADVIAAADSARLDIGAALDRLRLAEQNLRFLDRRIEAGCPEGMEWTRNPGKARVFGKNTIVSLGQEWTFYETFCVAGHALADGLEVEAHAVWIADKRSEWKRKMESEREGAIRAIRAAAKEANAEPMAFVAASLPPPSGIERGVKD